MEKSISVLLVDDDQLIRAGIRLLVEHIPNISIIGEVANGRDGLEQIEKLRPNVVLADILMPRLNGIELALRTHQRFRETKVVMLTVSTNEEHAWMAIHAHASGYVLKDSSIPELRIAIEAAAAGDVYVTPRMLKPLLRECFSYSNEQHLGPLTSTRNITIDRRRQDEQGNRRGTKSKCQDGRKTSNSTHGPA